MSEALSKVGVGVLLITLALLSLGLSFAHLHGGASLGAAMLIAACKAVLVGIFFMEIGREKASFKLALLAGGFLVLVLLGFVASDVWLRDPPPLPPPKTGSATAI